MSVLDDQSREQLRRQGATLAGIVGRKAKGDSVVSATVSRIDDDGTVWVSIGDAEAPAAPGMRASVGDKVSVRLSDGTATITDNRTRPATDDATALTAQETAMGAQGVAVNAQEVAEMAAEVAGAIGQHFWTDEAGVHVSTDEGDPAGQRNSIFNSLGLIFREGLNNLMGLVSGSAIGGSSSDRGMAIFDGLGNAASNVIAWFGRNGIRIGRQGEQHVEITSQGISITNGTTAGTVNGVDVVATASNASTALSTANAASSAASTASTKADAANTAASNAATAAGEASALAQQADGKATTAGTNATAALTQANKTKENFWADSSGVHVSTQSNTAAGTYNSLFTSAGLLFRNAANTLVSLTKSALNFYDGEGNGAANVTASFGKDEIRLGKAESSHLVADFHSMQLVDKNGNVYFHISDLRDEDNIATIEETFAGDSATETFYVGAIIKDVVNVKINGSATTAFTFSGYGVSFTTPPPANSTITVVYRTVSAEAKAYTAGIRKGGDIGVSSFVAGYENIASGAYSFAEGNGTRATGRCAHAEGSKININGVGYFPTASGKGSHVEGIGCTASGEGAHAQNTCTIAASANQTALGRYNASDTTSAVIIGNGTTPSNRSNALTVDWSGNVECGTVNGVDLSTGPYLPLSGGTLTGALNGTTAQFSSWVQAAGTLGFGNGAAGTQYVISAKTPSRNGRIIFVGGGKKADGDNAGTVVGLGAGGLTIVGGGEYATNRYNVGDLNDTAEYLYLGSDNDVYIETNGNTIANRKTFRFAAGGFFLMPTGGIIEADKRIDLGDRSVSGIDYHARLETSSTGTLHLIASSGGFSSSNTARGDFAFMSDGRLGVRKHNGTDWVSGWTYFNFSSAATLRDSIGAEEAGTCLPLSGGIMTGSIELASGKVLFAKNTTHDVAASSLSAQTDQNVAVCLDKNSNATVGVLSRQLTTGEMRGIFQARHNNASGTAVWNALQLGVKPDGTRTVTLSDEAPWLSALGLGSTTTATSGVVTAASGWTVVLQSLASWGRVRMLHLLVKNAEATSGTRKVATLAAAHKPKGPDAAIATMYSPTSGSGYVTTSGEIYIGGSLAANVEWNGMLMWLV